MENLIEFLSEDEAVNIYAGSASWRYVDGEWVAVDPISTCYASQSLT